MDRLAGMTLLETALSYATRNWPVFPVEPGGKRPIGRLVPHGLKDASTDPEQIRKWWTEVPEANIGIPTGIAFDVADLDDEEAMKRFQLLAAEHGADPKTFPRSQTPHGRHLLVAPTGLGNKVRVPGLGLDWRGQGGYIVAPGSIRPEGVYRWLHEPNGSRMPECPPWLRERLEQRPGAPEQRAASTSLAAPAQGPREAYVQKAVDAELEKVRSTFEGSHTRNDTLNRAAYALGQMVGAGWISRSSAEYDLLQAALSTRLPEREARATIDSGLSDGMLEPRPEPPELGQRGGVITHGRRRGHGASEGQGDSEAENDDDLSGFDAMVEPGPVWDRLAGERVPVIVGGFLVAGGLGLMISDPKAGKTWLVLELIISCVSGKPLLDRYPVEVGGKVLYIATEGAREGTRARLRSLVRGKDLEYERILNGVDFIWRKGVQLDDSRFLTWLREHATDYVLIVVDVLADAWGGNEDKSSAVSALVHGLRPIIDTGTTLLLVHHLSKVQAEAPRDMWQRIRGSTAWYGALDSGIALERPTGTGRTKVTFQHRDLNPVEPFTFTWPQQEVTGNEPARLDWQPADDELSSLQAAQVRVLKALVETPGQSKRDLAAALGLRPQTVGEAVDALEAASRIYQAGVRFERKDGRGGIKQGYFVVRPEGGTQGEAPGRTEPISDSPEPSVPLPTPGKQHDSEPPSNWCDEPKQGEIQP